MWAKGLEENRRKSDEEVFKFYFQPYDYSRHTDFISDCNDYLGSLAIE